MANSRDISEAKAGGDWSIDGERAAEPSFVRQYGPVPVLRMGGPAYDAFGIKKEK
jgi:hypothetical protein